MAKRQYTLMMSKQGGFRRDLNWLKLGTDRTDNGKLFQTNGAH